MGRWLVKATVLLCCMLIVAGCAQEDHQKTMPESSQQILEEDNENKPMDKKTLNDRLIQAAERGDTATVLQLLAEGADINAQDERGRTAALVATHGNKVETLAALVKAGADINIRDNRSDNPLLYSSAEGQLDIVKLCIQAGADTKLTNRYGGVGVIPASERGHVEVVRELLEHSDIDVNHVNKLGWTALLEAIVLSNGDVKHQQIVQLLVDHGADMNIADKEGVKPLQHARSRGYTEIVRILEKAGAR